MPWSDEQLDKFARHVDDYIRRGYNHYYSMLYALEMIDRYLYRQLSFRQRDVDTLRKAILNEMV